MAYQGEVMNNRRKLLVTLGAGALAFCDESHFICALRKRFGGTPGTFRCERSYVASRFSIRLAALIALSAVATACGDSANPFASFGTRCAKLPPTHFEVVAMPLTFERDDSQSIAALTMRRGSAFATHRTFGLTSAVFGYNTDIQLNVVDDRGESGACGTPRVRIELSMQAVTVYVASELAGQPCHHDVTLSHEMKHVEVFREALELAARDLARDFPVAIGVQLRPATNPSELQQRFVISVRDYLAQFMRDRQRTLDESQAAVDSPEEYARVSTACSQS
jgi:hypothetical protein